jgi:hypothetical protein
VDRTPALYSGGHVSDLGSEIGFRDSGLRFSFPSSRQINAETFPQIGPLPLPSTFFTIHYSLITLTF